MAAILKIFKSPYLSENPPILMKFGTLQQILNPMTVMWPKIEIFKIQDGGGHHLENRLFDHNSSTDCAISAKVYSRKQNSMLTKAMWQKLQIFKIQDGGRPPFWKSLNRHISVKNRPILVKFGTLRQILNPMTVSWPKLEMFLIQDGGDHHLENRFYSHDSRPIVRFQQNFVRESRTACQQRPHDKNCKFSQSKTVDSRHFENRLITISK